MYKRIVALFAVVLCLPLLASQASAQEAAQNTLIVFDASGSMQELFDSSSRLAAAKGAVFDFLDGQTTEVGLRMYAHVNHAGDQPSACAETALIQSFTSNYQPIKDYVTSIQAVGSYTPTAYALTEAANDFVPGAENTLILLTDGKETCDGDPAAAAAALKAAGINVITHVIGLGVDTETRTELQGIAAAGGGEYYDASDSQSLGDSFAAIEAEVDKTKIERDTTAVRGGNEISTAVPLTEGEYTLDHHQRPKEYDYFYLELEPGDSYYISIGYTGKDISWDEDTDTFSLPSYDDGPEGDSQRGNGHIYFLSHDGRTEKVLADISSESTSGYQEEDYANVKYSGGDTVTIQEARHYEDGREGAEYKAHPLVGNFERFYFKVGPLDGGHQIEMHKDVPFTIKKLESALGSASDAATETEGLDDLESEGSSASDGTVSGSLDGTDDGGVDSDDRGRLGALLDEKSDEDDEKSFGFQLSGLPALALILVILGVVGLIIFLVIKLMIKLFSGASNTEHIVAGQPPVTPGVPPTPSTPSAPPAPTVADTPPPYNPPAPAAEEASTPPPYNPNS